MSSTVDHVILTRFNLPSKGHESVVRAQEQWLKNRVGLFERYCLPSVLNQSCRDVAWIVYFDPQSPDWLLEWIEKTRATGAFTPIFREEVPREDLIADLRTVIGRPPRPRLVTTNLDNDDGLAADFVARVQAAVPDGPRTAVYLGEGLIRRGGDVYRRSDPHNAFCSVSEPWDAPVTCWSDWHNLLPQSMPAVVLRGAPGWLQVVHGANVSNRVRGRMAAPSRFRDGFPGLLDDLTDPPRAALLQDRLVAVPGRALREGARAGGKAVLGRLLGRQGLDRVKLQLAAARRTARRTLGRTA